MKSVNLSFLRRGCRVHGVKEEADTYDGAENPQKRREAMLMGVWSRQPSRQCPPVQMTGSNSGTAERNPTSAFPNSIWAA